MKPNEIEARLQSLGRPRADFRTIGQVSRSLAAAREWDARNPEGAAEHRRLVVLLEQETARIERETRERDAADKALRTMGAKLERAGVGERSLAAAADAQPSEALGVVQRWLPDASLTWLGLCGAKGTGKSVAATWAIREVIRGGSTGAFVRAGELVKLSQFDSGAAEVAWLKRVHLLVVDDFGTELLSDYARAVLHEVFDTRHENYGRTIITSNLRWQGEGGMRERLGERLADRFAQAGRLVQLAPEPSMRRKRVAESEVAR